MDLIVTIIEFSSDGRVAERGRMPGVSQQLDSAMLKGESALFLKEYEGANGFIVHDLLGAEVARWRRGGPSSDLRNS